MIVISIEVNFFVFFKGVDVVKYKEWICCEDVNVFFVFFVDDVKFGVLVWILVKLIFVSGFEKFVVEDLLDV